VLEAQTAPGMSCGGRAACQWACLLLAALSPAITTGSEPAAFPSRELFGDGAVARLRLEVTAEGLVTLRADGRQYVRGTLREETNVLQNVAVRIKGSVGSLRLLEDKPALTVSCDHFMAGQRFRGLSKFCLNNSVEDPSYLNEWLGSELLRAVGVPAPRVTHALLEFNGRKLGLYVLKEGFAEEFLARHFARADGNLYEAEAGGACDVTYPMKRNFGHGPDDRSDLRRLAAAALETDLARRWEKLRESLDMDSFLSFMAGEILIGHRDGYCLARNNFRLYCQPSADRFVFLPDGMDQLLGRPDLPVQPRMGGIVARAVMETRPGRQAYREKLTALRTNCFQVGVLTNRVASLAARLALQLGRPEARALQEEAAGLCERLRRRAVDLDRQLAAPLMEPISFVNGVAPISRWQPVDPPEGGQLDQTTGADGVVVLHIHAGPATGASWRATIRLEAGAYRFEALARTKGVRPRSFGNNHGAFLGMTGRKISGGRWLAGDTDWTLLQAEFEIAEAEAEVELFCALRASAGEAWFKAGSLRVTPVVRKKE
jgi:spore coat protein H